MTFFNMLRNNLENHLSFYYFSPAFILNEQLCSFLMCVFAPLRARLRPLPHGGKHLRGLRHRRLPGGRLLLHMPAAQAAHPAAHPLLPAQLPGRNHPHDPHLGSPEPAGTVATVQHGHDQLQLGRRRQLHAEVLHRRPAAAAAARLSGVRHHLLVGLHPHSDPSDSASSSAASILVPSSDLSVWKHPAPVFPLPAAAPSTLSPLSECWLPPAAAVLLPPAARRLRGSQGLRRLRTELTGLPARGNRGITPF